MKTTSIFAVEDVLTLQKQALQWAQQFDELCFLQSNSFVDNYSTITAMLAVKATAAYTSMGTEDSFVGLENFKTKHPKQWMLGFFSYELKNEIEALSSSFPNRLEFPYSYFFIPETVIQFQAHSVRIEALDPAAIYAAICATTLLFEARATPTVEVQQRMSKEKYMESFAALKQHIQQGDIYEVNLCQEFFAEAAAINPLDVYESLNSLSPTPFSVFFKLADKFILSASPERFLAKRANTLISQPIKGTARRGQTAAEDAEIIAALRSNPKEIAENVMIVDLVRNDLSRSALPGTVEASRKLEVHSFKQVHQLISTVTCQQDPALSDSQVIRNTFPPGSMTGAPKISAMRLCEQYENSMRGIYSGAVGYFAPEGDFDFNVIIRSILYNKSKQYLSFHTGGAITYEAVAEDEYAECLLKASAILTVLNSKLK